MTSTTCFPDTARFPDDLPAIGLTLRSIDVLVYRVPLQTPVQTSFGIMHDRPAVLLRLTDDEGAQGWGEVWCNFPAVGAEHRARLVNSVLAPLAIGRHWRSPAALFQELTQRTAVLALQSGEPGPIAHGIAGLDIAAWDLVARKSGQPLWQLLGGHSDSVQVYASGLNPDAPARLAADRQAEGYRAFKLKVGFGIDRDLDNLAQLRSTLAPDAVLMVDANQAWTREQALALVPRLEPFDLAWLEEPLRADMPWYEWQSLQSVSSIALAAGENVAGFADFDTAIGSGALSVIQPDLAKWGASPAACRSLAGSCTPVCVSARTTSAPASDCSRRAICWPRPAATECWRSTPTPILCAPCCGDRWPSFTTARRCSARARGWGATGSRSHQALSRRPRSSGSGLNRRPR